MSRSVVLAVGERYDAQGEVLKKLESYKFQKRTKLNSITLRSYNYS